MNMNVLNKMLKFNANLELENMRFFKKKDILFMGSNIKTKICLL